MSVTIRVISGMAAALLATGIAADGAGAEAGPVGEQTCTSEFVYPHDLRGVTSVVLDVDGLPSPFEGTDLSDATLARTISAALSKAGLHVLSGFQAGVPTLHFHVLAVNSPAQGFFVITAELQEPCRVARGGGVEIGLCSTWSLGPRIGFFTRDRSAVVLTSVSEVTASFTEAWAHEN
jgi:hypothetical protein